MAPRATATATVCTHASARASRVINSTAARPARGGDRQGEAAQTPSQPAGVHGLFVGAFNSGGSVTGRGPWMGARWRGDGGRRRGRGTRSGFSVPACRRVFSSVVEKGRARGPCSPVYSVLCRERCVWQTDTHDGGCLVLYSAPTSSIFLFAFIFLPPFLDLCSNIVTGTFTNTDRRSLFCFLGNKLLLVLHFLRAARGQLN